MRTALVLLVAACSPLGGAALADLVCASPVLMVGEVRSGKVVTGSFELTNTGTTPVEVLGVKVGCGCLRGQADAREVPPGQRCTVRLDVNTVTQAEGAQSWGAVVRYRVDGAEKELPVSVAGRVVAEVRISPATLVLHAGTSVSHTLALFDRRASPLAVTAARTGSPHFAVKVGEPARDAEAGWRRTLTLDMLPSCPEGTHEDAIHVLSSDPLYPELSVPFTVVKRVAGKVSVVPAAVALSGVRGQALPARVVQLEREEGPVVISRLESDSPAVSCSWMAGPGDRATVRVRVDGSKIGGEWLEGRVRITLETPAGQVVDVPVRCSLR